MKIKNKKILILPVLFLFSFLFVINFISAANGFAAHSPTLQFPNADECITGTVNLNGDFANNSCMACEGVNTHTANVTNGTFYYQLAGDSAWTLISSDNIVGNQTKYELNASWASTGIIDDTSVVFNLTLSNSTVVFDSTTLTSNVCNTNPTSSYASGSLEQNGAIYINNALLLSVSADTNGVDNCTVYFTTNSQRSNGTAVSNACTFSLTHLNFSNGALSGEFDYIISVRDGNGNQTNTTSRRLTLYNAPQGGGGGGGGVVVSPTIPTIQEPGQPVAQPSPETGISVGERFSNFGQKVSGTIQKIIDFIKNIVAKKS